MTSVGITGVNGLIGWHVRCRLHATGGFEIVPAGRETFASADALDRFVGSCDAIVHCAGMNRGDEAEIERTNEALAEQLVDACRRTARRPHIVFTNSIHATTTGGAGHAHSAYGRSKRRAAECFRRWSEEGGGPFTDLVLPHVFGEHGRPFYNSVVSTFCYQLARGDEPDVHSDAALELLHAQDVAKACVTAVQEGAGGQLRIDGHPLTVIELLATLRDLLTEYERQRVPDVRRPIDLHLFNTLRSYLYPDHYPVPVTVYADDRGALFEAIKSEGGGQTFLSTTRPGITRGNHYHLGKVERFFVVKGEALIRLRRVFTGDVQEFKVSGDMPVYVDIPVIHTHQITNIGSSELVTLFWAHEIFDPQNPDTTPEVV